jgi:hypothetical protein
MLRPHPAAVARILLTAMFPVALAVCGYAQALTFSKRYFLYDSLMHEKFLQVVPTQQGFLIAGNSYNPYLYGFNRLVFMVVDSAGNMLSKKTYGDSTHSYWVPEHRTIVPAKDSGFLMALTYTDTAPITILMKLNAWGDTLWTKEVNVMYATGIYPDELIRTDDGGYALCGKYFDQGCLQKLDSNCNPQWYKLFGETGVYPHSELCSVHSLPDGGFVIGYTTTEFVNLDGFVCRLDSTGNTIWTRTIAGNYWNDFIKVDLTADSTILAVSTHIADANDPYKKNIEVKTWTQSGSPVFENTLGPGKSIYLSHLDRHSDSTYIVSGHGWDDIHAWWMIFNDRAEAILYKDFYDILEPRGFFASIVTADDGVLSIGESKRYGRTDTDPWILKTDRYGCLTPGCDPYGIYVVSQPVSSEICTDDTATFCILANDDTSGVLFQIYRTWQEKEGSEWINLTDGNRFQGVTTDTLSVINATGMHGTYSFRCLLRNEKYYLASRTATLSVRQQVKITEQPVSQRIALTDTARFEISVEGEPPITLQWYFNGEPIPGATGNVYERFPVEYEDEHRPIQCKVMNSCNDVFSESAFIIINNAGTDPLYDVQDLHIYPVPATDVVCIDIPLDAPTDITFNLSDLAGKNVLSHHSDTKKTCIPIQGLTKGLYLLKISFNENDVYRKIILQ